MTMAQNHNQNLVGHFPQYLRNFLSPVEKYIYTFKREYFLVTLLLLAVFIVCVKLLLYRKQQRVKNVTDGNSFHLTVPRIQWTFLNIIALDGLITLIKLRKDGMKFVDDIVAKYGSLFRLPIGTQEFIAISDPNTIQKVLNSTHPGHLNKPKCLYKVLFSDLLKNGLLVADMDTWSPHRKAISKSFNENSFPTYLKFINDGAKGLIKESCLEAANTIGGTLDNRQMKELIEHFSVKVVTNIILGFETFHLSDNDRAEFQKAFQRGKEIALDRIRNPALMINPIWLLTRKKRELDRMMAVVKQFSHHMANCYRTKEFIKVVERQEHCNYSLEAKTDSDYFEMEEEARRQEEKDNELKGITRFECLIEQMIKAGMSNDEITDEVSTILIGGHGTVVTALDFLLFHLAQHPEHQRKCRMEFDKLFDSQKFPRNEDLTIENLSQLKYLERCILESLRITPTVPAFMRRLDVPLEIGKNSVLEAGQSLVIFPWAVHRNPEIYPNPTYFDPDRFLPENVDKRHSHSFIPFSMGIRNCIGWKIALLELKVYTAWILRHFEVRTTNKLEDVKMIFDITLKPERPFNLAFKRRNL